MPVYRGPDGKIIEENTRVLTSAQDGSRGRADIDGKTTRLSSRPVAPPSSGEQSDPPQKPDCVVGWLVIVAGGGQGTSFNLYAGANALGRGAGDVVLDFGDQQISRQNHATVTYDPKGNQFFVQGGGGRSLTYLNGEVVLTPQGLKNGDKIELGETELKFVAFCDDAFKW